MLTDMVAGLDNSIRLGREMVLQRFPQYEITTCAWRVEMDRAFVHVAMKLESGEHLSVDIPFESLVVAPCPWQKVASWMLTRVASFVAHEIATSNGAQA